MGRNIELKRFTALAVVLVAAILGGLAAVAATHVWTGGFSPAYVTTAQAASFDRQPLVSFADVVKRATPAVVNISSSKVVKAQKNAMEDQLFNDPMFRQFFGGRAPNMGPQRDRRQQSLGSGVITSPDGYILTNNHVVEGATQVKVVLADHRDFTAKVVGTDPLTDIAVLKIDARGLPVLPLSDSSKVEVGDVTLAIGDPFGIGQTVTMGIVSATGRSNLGIEPYEQFIQTDAAINPGNSGGALVNSQGALIGINTAILSGSGGNQGIGFAVPVNLARNVMTQLMEHGKVTRGYIGATIQEVTPSMAKAFGLAANAHGVALTEIEPGGPADHAGLKAGDVVTAVNGKPVEDMNGFRFQVAEMVPGSNVNLTVNRGGNSQNMTVKLGERPGEHSADRQSPEDGSKNALNGVSVDDLTPQVARELELPRGTRGVVVTDVDQSSPAAEAGLQRGDIIQEVNRKPVTSSSEFESAVRQGRGNATLLLVRRGERTLFVAIGS